MRISSEEKKEAQEKFEQATGSGRVALLYGLLNDLSIIDRDRFELAYQFLKALPQSERNAVYPGPIHNYHAFLLTRQFINFDLPKASHALDLLLSEDKETVLKFGLNSRPEILRFVENLIGRYDNKRRPKLLDFAQATLVHQKGQPS